MQNNNSLPDALRNLERVILKALPTLPVIMGNEAVNFAKDNFRSQGFLGARMEHLQQ